MNLPYNKHQIHVVTDFQELISTPFHGEMNAICWKRDLKGDFAEIIHKVSLKDNMKIVEEEELLALNLTKQGQMAREILLHDLKLLKEHGASPVLNIIKCYERDDEYPFFPTDVYSFHVDRSPIPTDTFLCTYYGDPSEILPNAHAQQKILVPEIREELKRLYNGPEKGFESFLSEHFFDLHYQPKADASLTSLGVGHLWRLAIDHPEQQSLPCIHRAPIETAGQKRLLMIC